MRSILLGVYVEVRDFRLTRLIVFLVFEQDEDALRSLKDIELQYLEDTKPGFKLLFHFDKVHNRISRILHSYIELISKIAVIERLLH